MKRLLGIAVLFFGLVTGWQARAEEPPGKISVADAMAIHDAVSAQLDALAVDDAAAAFALATPARRMQIGTADNFLQMIKDQYNPIYRNLRTIFSAPEVVDGNTVQIVRITDRDSHVWLAIFWMQQGEDSTWRIDGCHLLETTAISI
jgi:hypothetical protein